MITLYIDRNLLQAVHKAAATNDLRQHLNGVAVTHNGKLWVTDAIMAIRTIATAVHADAPRVYPSADCPADQNTLNLLAQINHQTTIESLRDRKAGNLL